MNKSAPTGGPSWTRTVFGTGYNSDGTPDFGEVSDGYHTFNELYEHRTILFACLTKVYNPDKVWMSNKHHDGSMFSGMFIVGMETPAGTVTYHIDNKYKALFSHVRSLERAPKWDGSTPKDGLDYLIKSYFLLKD